MIIARITADVDYSTNAEPTSSDATVLKMYLLPSSIVVAAALSEIDQGSHHTT